MYQIVDIVTGEVVETGFQTRQDAKVKRNELNAEHFNELQMYHVTTSDVMPRFVVSRSENHPRGESVRLDEWEVEAAKRHWPSRK